ncbi:MAG: hypothetical protein ACK5LS_07390 [Propioniciclava sp.]
MRRAFWFALGSGVTAWVILKGPECARRLTAGGRADHGGPGINLGLTRAKEWAEDFGREYHRARAARHAELTDLLSTSERGRTR